jgi:hypothetical protein
VPPVDASARRKMHRSFVRVARELYNPQAEQPREAEVGHCSPLQLRASDTRRNDAVPPAAAPARQ